MQFTRFGGTGISVSRICMGTATFGQQTDEPAAHAILSKAAEAGVNFIETADGYPMDNSLARVGRAEQIVGRWLEGKRDRFIIATKGGVPVGPSSWDRGTSKKHLLDAIDGSLKRLSTDYVDLYQLHFDDSSVPLDETLEALDLIVRAGKARYVGVSNFLAYRLARALGRSDQRRLVRFVSVQPRYCLLFREIERELIPLASEENLAVMPYSALAGGMLAGRYRYESQPTGGRFSPESGWLGEVYRRGYWHSREFATIASIEQIAKQRGLAIARLAIGWVLANSAVTSVVLGASRATQLIDTLAAVNLDVDAELKKQLDDLTDEYRRGDATI
jgi:aryl-alcohol dehydrogenase-like predicted oxidoreductase